MVSPSSVISGALCISQFRSRLKRAVLQDKNLVRIHGKMFLFKLVYVYRLKKFDLFINNFFKNYYATGLGIIVGGYIILLTDYLPTTFMVIKYKLNAPRYDSYFLITSKMHQQLLSVIILQRYFNMNYEVRTTHWDATATIC